MLYGTQRTHWAMLIFLNLDTKKLSCKITKCPSLPFPAITLMHVNHIYQFFESHNCKTTKTVNGRDAKLYDLQSLVNSYHNLTS